ncbi:MAG: hypothetical protein H7Y32_02555 [Chloroflexales bacterium]|nr:hypothetical protein [Chloroflexales bacterium]
MRKGRVCKPNRSIAISQYLITNALRPRARQGDGDCGLGFFLEGNMWAGQWTPVSHPTHTIAF